MNIYFVDDNQESIQNFNARINDLTWIDFLFETGVASILNVGNSSNERSLVKQKIIEGTGLSSDDYDYLFRFFRQYKGNKSQDILNPLLSLRSKNIILNVNVFCMKSDLDYKQALDVVTSDSSNCALFLDIDWNTFQIEDSKLLTFKPVQDAYDQTPNKRKYLGAYNLACEFLCNGQNRWIVSSTKLGIETTPDIKEFIDIYLERDCHNSLIKSNLSNNQKNIIDKSSSVESTSACLKIIELLFYQRQQLTLPLVKLKSTAINQNWFIDGNPYMPHDFSQERKLEVSAIINEVIYFDSYNYTKFTHEGIKNYCLGRAFCHNVLYFAAVVALSKQRQELGIQDAKESPLPPSNPIFIDDIDPIHWSSRNNIIINDLVKYAYAFFKGFYERSTVTLSTDSKSLTLTSNISVREFSDYLNERISYYQEKKYWETEHETSLHLAKFIAVGGCGLIDFNGREVIPFTGKDFGIVIQGKQVIFSWADTLNVG